MWKKALLEPEKRRLVEQQPDKVRQNRKKYIFANPPSTTVQASIPEVPERTPSLAEELTVGPWQAIFPVMPRAAYSAVLATQLQPKRLPRVHKQQTREGYSTRSVYSVEPPLKIPYSYQSKSSFLRPAGLNKDFCHISGMQLGV